MCVCALTSPHKLPARGYFIDEYYFLSTPCLSALNELSDSIQISPSRKTSMVCCMDYYTTAFKWAFFVESSIKPIVCVRPYDFSRCCECTVLCGILTGFISLQWHTKPAGLLCFMMQFEAKVVMENIFILLRYHELLSDLYSSYVWDVEKNLVKLRLQLV